MPYFENLCKSCYKNLTFVFRALVSLWKIFTQQGCDFKHQAGEVRGIIRIVLNTLSHLILTPTLRGRYYYLNFVEEIGTSVTKFTHFIGSGVTHHVFLTLKLYCCIVSN